MSSLNACWHSAWVVISLPFGHTGTLANAIEYDLSGGPTKYLKINTFICYGSSANVLQMCVLYLFYKSK